MHHKYKHIEGILPRLSGDYPDSLRILSADRSIIREAYPAYPLQVWYGPRVAEDKLSYPVRRIIILSEDSLDIR